MSNLNTNSMHWSKLNRDVDIPKLDCDVDLDELDFEVLPWLMNFCELHIKEDPDRDDTNLRSEINSNETNNNDCQNRDISNQKKEQLQCDIWNFSTVYSKIHKRIHRGLDINSLRLHEGQFRSSIFGTFITIMSYSQAVQFQSYPFPALLPLSSPSLIKVCDLCS